MQRRCFVHNEFEQRRVALAHRRRREKRSRNDSIGTDPSPALIGGT
jgi:hypothetical protein